MMKKHVGAERIIVLSRNFRSYNVFSCYLLIGERSFFESYFFICEKRRLEFKAYYFVSATVEYVTLPSFPSLLSVSA